MSIVGGVGMFSTSIFQPFIGGWIDSARTENAAAGLTGNALELATGQHALQKMMIFPAILIVLFLIFFFWQKKFKGGLQKVKWPYRCINRVLFHNFLPTSNVNLHPVYIGFFLDK